MKKLRIPILVILVSLFIVFGCQRKGGEDVFGPLKNTTVKK